MERHTNHLGIAWVLCLLFAACTVGPDYRRPETVAEKTAAFRSVPDDLEQVVAADDFSRWWRSLEDPLMDEYVDRLLAQNLQLKEAAARVRQAWAGLGVARGDQLPSLAVSGSAARRFQSLDSIGASSGRQIPGGGGGERVYFTQLETGLSTSWQIDLFGQIERSVAAARKRYLANRAEAGALIHSLIAELARRRVSLATLKRRIEITEETVESRRLTLKTVESRYRRGAGDITAVDVYLARENVSAAAAEIPDLRSRLTEEAHALDVLLGLAPGATDPLEAEIPVLPPPRTIPVGLPAGLVDRRPDLRANELRMAAAVEEIGVAVADLYPDLTLSGNIGFQDNELENFFDSSNLFGAILADIMAPLFQGGRLRANIDLREAQAQELAAAYAGDVLNALEEVETALSNAAYLASRIEILEERLESIREAEDQLEEKYRRGLVSLLEVLEIQRRRYMAEETFLLAAQAAWNNRIALYLALGGDWLPEVPMIRPVSPPTDQRAP